MDYTDQVSLYMDAADVLLTKPGGLTSTEAAAKRLPLILTAPIRGCETRNSAFYARHNMALAPNNTGDYLQAVRTLLDDESIREQMREAQALYVNPFSASMICEFILEDSNKNFSTEE